VRPALVGALLLNLALVASACADGSAEEERRFGRFRPRAEQVLYYNNFEEPEYVDPGLLTGHPDSFVASQLFEGLTEPDPKTLEARPGVAERWSVSDDGLEYRFFLREDARWSDGEKVVAKDFVYAWERVLRPTTAARYGYQLYALDGARGYNEGRVKRIVGENRRPRRAPYVVLGAGRPPEPPAIHGFAPDAKVWLVDSNLRTPAGETSVFLLEEPKDDAHVVTELDPGELGLVLVRRVQSGTEDRPGHVAPDAWVQLRPAAGGGAAWVRERLVKPAFPSVNARRVEGARHFEDRQALRAESDPASEILGYVDDDEEVELVRVADGWGRVQQMSTGQVGWVPEESLDDVAGDRQWFYVRVLRDAGSVEGPPLPQPWAQEGWVPGRYLFADATVLGVEAASDKELVVHLERPTPYFLSLTSFSALRPVPRRVVERWGREWTRPEHIVTNGPFHLDFHRARDRMELVRSETYWDRRNVQLDRVVIYSVSDVHTNVNLFRAGYLDAMISAKLPVELVAGLRDKRDYVAGPYLATYFVRLNTTVKPLDDVRVRRALNLAIDKKLLTERLLRGGQEVATHIVPPGMPDYPVIDGDGHDPKRARELLAEAGFPGGKGFPRLEFLFNTSEDHRLIAEFLQRQWHDVLGVDIGLANQEWKTFLKKLHAMDYQLTRSGWIGDYVDPNTFLEMWVSGGGNNETGYANDDYDALITRASQERDAKTRARLLADAEAMLNRDVPFLPLFYYVNNFLLAPEVRGYHPNLLDEHPLKHVWIDPDALDAR
jgi:ABC-type oligopeptide transport system substrate-binding subunit